MIVEAGRSYGSLENSEDSNSSDSEDSGSSLEVGGDVSIAEESEE
jgi:hypothetical protein